MKDDFVTGKENFKFEMLSALDVFVYCNKPAASPKCKVSPNHISQHLSRPCCSQKIKNKNHYFTAKSNLVLPFSLIHPHQSPNAEQSKSNFSSSPSHQPLPHTLSPTLFLPFHFTCDSQLVRHRKPQVPEMTDAQVTAWLRCAGLSRFAPRFGAACVSENTFLQLSSSDLDALGVDGPADRKRLHDLIAELRRSADMPPRRSTPPRSSTLPTLHQSASRPVLETLSQPNSAVPATSASTNNSLPKSHLTRTTRHIPNPSTHSTPSSIQSAAKDAAQNVKTMRPAKVTVCVRKRPLSRKELASNNADIIVVNQPQSSLYVHELKQKVDLTKYVETHPFAFDRVFGHTMSNVAVYEQTARPLVDALFKGGRGTCFAYGQTGAGKTFTMAGDGHENPGLYTLAVRDLFDRIRRIESEQWRAAEAEGDDDFVPPDPPQVWISFYEIYASKLQDLLNRSGKLECREDSNNEVQIVGLTQRLCEVEEDVLGCIDEGSAARATGVTGANDDSSRSHAVFQIELRNPPSSDETIDANMAIRQNVLRGSQKSQMDAIKKGTEIGRLCFIDLAGSERGIDTASSTRQTRMEGAEINKSLLALKECIRAMDQRKDHTPFRGSKLTQVLKASFMSKNCRTVMIANISPASSNVEHTLNTLRYSDRVKEIKRSGKQSSGADATRNFGGRRATYSSGLGTRGRQSAVILPPANTSSGSDTDAMDVSPPEHLVSEKKPPKSFPDRSATVEDTLLSSQARGLPRRRTATKLRSRPSDASALFPMAAPGVLDRAETSKSREVQPQRRRISRAASQIPTRPSLASSMLPRPPTHKSKISADGNTARSSSGLKRPSPQSSVTDAESTQHESSDEGPEDRIDVRSIVVRQAGAASASGMITRRRAKQLEAQAKVEVDKKPRTRSKSPTEDRPSRTKTTRTKTTRERKEKLTSIVESGRSSDVSLSTDDLSEDEILYSSSDDLVSAVTAAAKMSNAMTAERDAMVADKMDADTEARRSSAKNEKPSRSLVSAPVEPHSLSHSGSPSIVDSVKVQKPEPRKADEKLRSVIRLHHAQIEELMRLTEADVTLINAVENGELDPQDYALKLSVNLSQKVDIVRALQAKAKLLE